MERQICKIQRPIVASDGNMQNLLIYNEDKSQELPADEEMMTALFPNNELKVYWWAQTGEGNMLELLEPADEPDW